MDEELGVYKKGAELAQIGVWELDIASGELFWDSITRTIHEVDESYQPDLVSAIGFYADEEYKNKIKLHLQEVFVTGEPSAAEFKIVTAKNNIKWVIAHLRADLCDGKAVRAYGTFQDITFSKTLIETLLISEEKFRQAFEFAPIGMALVSTSGNWLKVNKSLCLILGYTAEELMEITFQDITHPDDLDKDLEYKNKMLSREIDVYSIEKRYFNKDNKIVWTQLGVTLVWDSAGIPQYFISQIVDITAHKQNVDELMKERLHLEHVIQSTDAGVWEWEIWTDRLYFNEQCMEMLGYAPDELPVNKADDWRAIIHPEDLSRCNQSLERCLHHEIGYFAAEYRALHKNGYWIWIDVMGKVVEWTSDRNPVLMIGTHKDITARKEIEQERKQSLEIINDQNKRLLNFAHIVSHNLRSHASNMQMMVDLLADEEDEQEKIAIMKLLRQNAVNLRETVTNLNEIVQLKEDTDDDKKCLCLAMETKKALLNVGGSIAKIKAEVLVEIDEQIQIRHLPAYLESILLNMLTNAIKYRDPQRRLRIVIRAEEKEHTVLLQIEDNGLGIDLNLYGNKLFGMYKTFHQHDEARGIGLYITRNQIESLGGRIDLESEVGKGTTFSIHFKK